MKKIIILIVFLLLFFLAACGGEEQPPAQPQPTPPELHGLWEEPPVEWIRNDILSLEEARRDLDFGAFIPTAIPDDFSLRGALRLIAHESNALVGRWYVTNGLYLAWGTPPAAGHFAGSMELLISEATASDRSQIVSMAEEDWEASLDLASVAEGYPISETMWNPVFLAEELTFEVVEMRLESIESVGYHRWLMGRFGFGILFGDTLVQIRAWDVSPEQVWAMFEEMLQDYALEREQNMLSLEEARFDPDFGAFIPTAIPDDFHLQQALRLRSPEDYPWVNQWYVRNGLHMTWSRPQGEAEDGPVGSLELLISEATEYDQRRVVSMADGEDWEMTWNFAFAVEGYPVSETMSNPVFLAEELTFDIIEARLELLDFSDYYRWRTAGAGFGVLFADVLVQLRTLDVSPEQVWAMFAGMLQP